MQAIKSKHRTFQPIEVMGYFWFVLGIAVLIGTFFIQETPYIKPIRGAVTNIVCGAILFFIGLLSILRGRAIQKKISNS